MNSMKLKEKIRKIAKEKNVDFNSVLRLYMYDRFIERLSLSRYRDNFIIKGGFYLSSFFEIENRTPLICRKNPKFSQYFNLMWKELGER